MTTDTTDTAKPHALSATTRLAGPVRHTSPLSRETPLIYADSATAAPGMSALARRVAHKIPAPEVEATDVRDGVYGTHQRWTLTRVAFPPGDRPRRLVRRQWAISSDELQAFAEAPPPDAIVLPEGVDGLIDGATPEGTFAFYCVLEGATAEGPWRPLPLAPVSPPFDAVTVPFCVGPCAERLGESVALLSSREGAADETTVELLVAAVAFVPVDHPLRDAVVAMKGGL